MMKKMLIASVCLLMLATALAGCFGSDMGTMANNGSAYTDQTGVFKFDKQEHH